MDELVVLTDYRTDDTPLLCTSNGGVSVVCKSTDYTVSADDGLFRFNDYRHFVPNEWFFQNFEKLLVNDWSFHTGNSPLVFGNQKRRNRVLNSHDEVIEFLKSFEVENTLSPSVGVNSHLVWVS